MEDNVVNLRLADELQELVRFIFDVKKTVCEGGAEYLVLELRMFAAVAGSYLVVCTLKPPGCGHKQA